MFPSPQFRQCTSDLKHGPIDKFICGLPHNVIVNCIGIRAEKSHARARLSPLSINQSLSTRQRTVYNWFPIREQSLSESRILNASYISTYARPPAWCRS